MSETAVHIEQKIPVYYLVQRHLILGQPNTVRPFRRGEAVEESDFSRCPQMFSRLLRRGSLKLAYPHEVPAAIELRRKNEHLDIGLDDDATPYEVQQRLAERDPSLPAVVAASAERVPPPDETGRTEPATVPAPRPAGQPVEVDVPPPADVPTAPYETPPGTVPAAPTVIPAPPVTSPQADSIPHAEVRVHEAPPTVGPRETEPDTVRRGPGRPPGSGNR